MKWKQQSYVTMSYFIQTINQTFNAANSAVYNYVASAKIEIDVKGTATVAIG